MRKLEIKYLKKRKYGRLSIIAESSPKVFGNARHRVVTCRCDCGNHIDVVLGSLRAGYTKSCGCLRVEKLKTHGKSNARIYKIWAGMKSRCHNKNCQGYAEYGEKGISVCDEWKSNFINFHIWAMNNGYNKELSIDRIDNDKGYSPDNCRWATTSKQSLNRGVRKDNTSGFRGVNLNKPMRKWAARVSINKAEKHLGYFDTPEDAAEARDSYIRKNRLDNRLSLCLTTIKEGDNHG